MSQSTRVAKDEVDVEAGVDVLRDAVLHDVHLKLEDDVDNSLLIDVVQDVNHELENDHDVLYTSPSQLQGHDVEIEHDQMQGHEVQNDLLQNGCDEPDVVEVGDDDDV